MKHFSTPPLNRSLSVFTANLSKRPSLPMFVALPTSNGRTRRHFYIISLKPSIVEHGLGRKCNRNSCKPRFHRLLLCRQEIFCDFLFYFLRLTIVRLVEPSFVAGVCFRFYRIQNNFMNSHPKALYPTSFNCGGAPLLCIQGESEAGGLRRHYLLMCGCAAVQEIYSSC